MNLKKLQDFIDRETNKKDEVKTARKFAIGIGLLAVAGLAAEIAFALRASKKTRKEIKEKALDAAGSIKTIIGSPKKDAAANDIPSQIENLVRLKEQGVLTEDEFNQKKTELLAKM